MSTLRYLSCRNPVSCRVCETAPAIRLVPRIAPKTRVWNNDEIAHIRRVFQKLVALRVQNDHDAEDLVQEALLTMVAKYPENSLEKGLLVWGMAILRKKVGNYYRRIKRYVPFDDRDFELGFRTREREMSASAESRLRLNELHALIDRILEGFVPQERVILELHLAGLRTQEIASELRPERYQNVVNRLYRGRKRLARELRRYGYQARCGP